MMDVKCENVPCKNGIITIKSIQIDYSGTGRPMNYIEINPEFSELLEHTQGKNHGINSLFQETQGVSDGYSKINPKDFVNLQGRNDGINNKFHENNLVPKEIKPIFTKLPKPIGELCFICEETRPIFWIDQSNNNYCVTCKKEMEKLASQDINKKIEEVKND